MFPVDSWTALDGFIEPAEGQFLYDEVIKLNCGAQILEVGPYHGKSTVAMLCACKDSNCSDNKKSIISVDYFAGQGMTALDTTPEETATGIEIVNRVVNEWGLGHWFTRLDAMKSETWFAQHTTLHCKIDFIFVDGCHQLVDQDLSQALPYLHSGSIVVCHDYWPHDHYFSWITQKIESVGLDFTRLGTTNLGKAVIK